MIYIKSYGGTGLLNHTLSTGICILNTYGLLETAVCHKCLGGGHIFKVISVIDL